MKKIFSILCVCSFLFTAHATLRMPDITVTKITQLGVTSNVGFKVKDSNEWLKADAEGKWTVTSTDTPVQGAIGDKDYSGFFFTTTGTNYITSGSDKICYYIINHTLADINNPANGIVVDPETPGGTLLAPRLGATGETIPADYFLIEGNDDFYVLIYNGKVYGTSDKTKATKFEAYQLANANHNVSCVQTALPATCTEGGHNAVYQCSICQKYFKQQTCEVETTISDEVVDALGHDYLVVKDEDGKATWTWEEDKSSALLQVVCTRDASHNDNQNVPTTADLSVTDATGFKLTYSATVTYNSTEYKDEKEVSLEDAPASVTVATAPTYTRTMANQWGTLVVPFALAYDEGNPYDLYTLSSVSADAITLSKVTSNLAAGTPVLVRMGEGAKNSETNRYTLSLTASNNTVSTAITNPAAVGGLTLTGSYAVEEITNKEGFIIGNNAFWNIQAVKGENKVYNSPFRAYLAGTISSGGSVKQLNIRLDGETTGIEAIDTLSSDEAELFDLGGRRITSLQKGINIVKRGGKSFKVIIK